MAGRAHRGLWLALLLVATSAGTSRGGAVDLTGTWVLDEAASAAVVNAERAQAAGGREANRRDDGKGGDGRGPSGSGPRRGAAEDEARYRRIQASERLRAALRLVVVHVDPILTVRDALDREWSVALDGTEREISVAGELMTARGERLDGARVTVRRTRLVDGETTTETYELAADGQRLLVAVGSASGPVVRRVYRRADQESTR